MCRCENNERTTTRLKWAMVIGAIFTLSLLAISMVVGYLHQDLLWDNLVIVIVIICGLGVCLIIFIINAIIYSRRSNRYYGGTSTLLPTNSIPNHNIVTKRYKFVSTNAYRAVSNASIDITNNTSNKDNQYITGPISNSQPVEKKNMERKNSRPTVTVVKTESGSLTKKHYTDELIDDTQNHITTENTNQEMTITNLGMSTYVLSPDNDLISIDESSEGVTIEFADTPK